MSLLSWEILAKSPATCKQATGAGTILVIIQVEIASFFLLALKQPQSKLISIILLSSNASQQKFLCFFNVFYGGELTSWGAIVRMLLVS